MQQSSSSEDVDMEPTGSTRSNSCGSLGVFQADFDVGSIDELSAKFSVQGTSNSKTSGKKKVVSNRDKFQKGDFCKKLFQYCLAFSFLFSL